MMIYGFIPVRSGSKGIPLKNIKPMCGKPLTQWAIDASNNSEFIYQTFISTDSEIISTELNGCEIFNRSAETATDTASSESALIEFCETLSEDDLVVFIQATSPLLTSEEIDDGIKKIIVDGYDSALSVVRQKRFIWNEDGTPENYDIKNRPRRQEWDGHLVENGAFYISTVRNILKTKLRVSGDIALIECDESSYYEIDDLHDWVIVENLMKNKYDL